MYIQIDINIDRDIIILYRIDRYVWIINRYIYMWNQLDILKQIDSFFEIQLALQKGQNYLLATINSKNTNDKNSKNLTERNNELLKIWVKCPQLNSLRILAR